MKFLIDEDLSPQAALYLQKELLVDAVSVRDRGLLGADDRQVFKYAFDEDRIIVTANIADFEDFINAYEVHGGIVFIQEGDLLRHEQISVITEAVKTIQTEIKAGRDMLNRVLYISFNGTKWFKNSP
ncbi:DUF5615 family PIN-like protein [Gloeocapsa sp. PCC 73106]|uniref:DUF5615 family PIN-like protein n=1 Tax=Gloeocapsa sp. PCC 73106 TaxID=102232 RepID=UPI0002ACB570|nr:DUF5615 family PIN-like protein [Gloeocapsa sp. PCC 73106]ELR97662.1 hypothetical protein GLO73106DRAFT_00014750 [Gloeocapsa sp. PCC 73106]